ncbi:hypothetical protein COOONC_04734 [Cooperia oncophora]
MDIPNAPINPRDSHEPSPSVDDTSALLDNIFPSTEERVAASSRKTRQSSISNIFGSPVRRKIDVDEWVQEGRGKYTREAVVMFEKVQEEEQRLKLQRLSESGGIEWVNLGGQFKIKTWFSGNYPAEYSGLKTIYVCDGCFSYFSHEPSQIRHMVSTDFLNQNKSLQYQLFEFSLIRSISGNRFSFC